MARPGLTGHRKFRRLARLLGSVLLARGALELLWESCYESGDDYVGTSEDIETLVGWTGEHGMLTRALVEAGAPEGQGFIEPASEPGDGGSISYRVHDLWHHAPDYVAKRRQRELARQQKQDPSVRRTAPNGAGSAQMPLCQDGVDRTPSPSPSPSPSHEGKNGSDELSLALPVLEFPVIGPGPERWPLSEAQVAEWAVLYPGLDVRGEARKAYAWVLASPGRRKTAKGMARFLVAWLGRAVDAGRATRQSGHVTTPARERCQHQSPCPDSWSHGQLIEAERLGDAETIAGVLRVIQKRAVAS